MTLSHDFEGSGPAVLLLHSTASDRRMWDPQMPALAAAGFRAVRCDLPGFGDSPVPGEPYDTAAEVAAVLDGLGIAQAAVVGASGGGAVALEIAARWPDRVTALALLCSAIAGLEPGPELRAFWDEEDALIEAGDVEGATDLNVRTWLGPRAGDETHEALRRMQQHAFEVQLAAGDAEEIETPYELSAIRARTLLLTGAHDFPDFHRIAAGLAGQLPGARHLDLDWAGHLPSMEDPATLNPILLEFLSAA
jgi:pimeloyl-ACP methyl ester carboxylesterase